ncbi:NKAP domain containing 1 [Clarias gariepinus]|uniref:NKAP domain containing 1 n=1 Tax=Clarias gariepinus TaxID=13013 RepID=UPI00234D42C6|nr:NKAP domain containing 1 [Clarias gariepinus]
MAKVPLGKVLLRNVIRHTDAHNKIQEESEMWKLRKTELQTSTPRESKQSWGTRSSMHCDRYLKESGSTRDRLGERECLTERDDREARYWTRKLYDFEANDPDRWGHSGFKELYPEEFHPDGVTDDPEHRRNFKDKMSSEKHKKSKKSSKRKKKKKKKKQRTEGSDSESDSSATDGAKSKPKRKSGKSKHRRKKAHKHKATEEDSSTDDSEFDRRREKTHRKRCRTVIETQTEPERKKRKNWKAANEEKSEESSED